MNVKIEKTWKKVLNFKITMEYSVIEITEADSIETLLQIISDKSLWEEIASTYGIDTVRFWERHEENEIDYYFETSDLKFNLKTLLLMKKSQKYL